MKTLNIPTLACIHGIPRSHQQCSFGNFDFADNEELIDWTLRFLTGEKFWMYLEGEPGRGKTHYVVALHRALVAKAGYEGADSSVFVEYRKLMNYLRSGVAEFAVDDILHEFLDSECLIIDDLNGTISDFEMKRLEEIVIDRCADHKRLVITSNENYANFLGRFSVHEVSRIQSLCVAIHFGGTDRRNQ